MHCYPNNRRPFMQAALTLVLAFSQAATAGGNDDAPHSRWWGGFGLGLGTLNGKAGTWAELQGGVRIDDHWQLGIEISGVGVDISRDNYDPNDFYSSVYGQSVTNEFVMVQYAPWPDRGWLFAIGGGGLRYDNAALRRITYEKTNGTGTGFLVRVSRDWKSSSLGYYGIDLSCERGDIRLKSPFDGKFGVTMFALGFHYTLR